MRFLLFLGSMFLSNIINAQVDLDTVVFDSTWRINEYQCDIMIYGDSSYERKEPTFKYSSFRLSKDRKIEKYYTDSSFTDLFRVTYKNDFFADTLEVCYTDYAKKEILRTSRDVYDEQQRIVLSKLVYDDGASSTTWRHFYKDSLLYSGNHLTVKNSYRVMKSADRDDTLFTDAQLIYADNQGRVLHVVDDDDFAYSKDYIYDNNNVLLRIEQGYGAYSIEEDIFGKGYEFFTDTYAKPCQEKRFFDYPPSFSMNEELSISKMIDLMIPFFKDPNCESRRQLILVSKDLKTEFGIVLGYCHARNAGRLTIKRISN